MDILDRAFPLFAFTAFALMFGVISLCSIIGHKYQRDDDAIFCTRCGKRQSL